MTQLVDIYQAHKHLRIDDDDADEDLDIKIEQASEIVIDYLKTSNSGWEDPDTVPYPIQAATLLVLGVLWEEREGAVDPLTDAVKSLLHRFRDPALA